MRNHAPVNPASKTDNLRSALWSVVKFIHAINRQNAMKLRSGDYSAQGGDIFVNASATKGINGSSFSRSTDFIPC
ncbi:hypothetical protein PIPA1_36890 [Pelosinus sp. IPA-1]|nr:hypothetical protein PIPA1_36890 [Pelosinus sp. IPA-1]